MKKAITINARYTLAAILSIMLFIVLVGFTAGAVKSADAADTKEATDYGTVDWSASADGYITFTAAGGERVFVLQGPSGAQTIFAVNEGKTVNAALMDGAGTYQYLIGCYVNSGNAYLVNYKNAFVVDETDIAPAP